MTTTTEGPVSFRQLATLLVDEYETEQKLIRTALQASRAINWSFPVLLLTMLAREGVPLSPPARREIERAQRRRETYGRALEEIDRTGSHDRWQVCKGATIQSFYDPDITRHVGDLDVCIETPAGVFLAADAICRTFPVQRVKVLTANRDRHVAVALSWPSEDPLYEPDLHIDLFTTPYVGSSSVPLRSYDWSCDTATQSVLLLCEERMQREFRITDLIDVAHLRRSVPLATVMGHAKRLMLGTQLVELAHAASLAGLVPEEEFREVGKAAAGEEEPPAAMRLAGGLMVRRHVPSIGERPPFQLIDLLGSDVLLTRFADFLMVSQDKVDEDLVDGITQALSRIDPQPPSTSVLGQFQGVAPALADSDERG